MTSVCAQLGPGAPAARAGGAARRGASCAIKHASALVPRANSFVLGTGVGALACRRSVTAGGSAGPTGHSPRASVKAGTPAPPSVAPATAFVTDNPETTTVAPKDPHTLHPVGEVIGAEYRAWALRNENNFVDSKEPELAGGGGNSGNRGPGWGRGGGGGGGDGGGGRRRGSNGVFLLQAMTCWLAIFQLGHSIGLLGAPQGARAISRIALPAAGLASSAMLINVVMAFGQGHAMSVYLAGMAMSSFAFVWSFYSAASSSKPPSFAPVMIMCLSGLTSASYWASVMSLVNPPA